MILVVAVALGAVSLRTTLQLLPLGWFPKGRIIPPGFAERYVDFCIAQAVPLLVLASLTVVALSLRPPVPPRRRLARRPGFIVSAAAVVGAVSMAAWVGAYHAMRGDLFAYTVKDILVFSVPSSVGYTVLGAWLAMALSGRSRPARSPLDVSGYALGVVWFALFIFCCARFYLQV